MMLEKLYSIIIQRLKTKPKNSYVAALAKNGEDEILQKIGEEATEVIIAVKGNNRNNIISEIADLYFMTLVLLADKEIDLNEIYKELKKRNKRDPLLRSG